MQLNHHKMEHAPHVTTPTAQNVQRVITYVRSAPRRGPLDSRPIPTARRLFASPVKIPSVRIVGRIITIVISVKIINV